MGSVSSPHFLIFPFMSKGHTIPLLHLGRLLSQRDISVTIITTPANSPSVQAYLQDTRVSIIELPFPENIDGVPPGVENTEKLPSISLFLPFAQATKLMQQRFEQVLETIQPVTCLISDAFFGWTQQSAAMLGIPRLVFFGMSSFGMTMYQILGRERPHAMIKSLDKPFSIPGFPELRLTRNDFEAPFCDPEPEGPYVDFMMEQIIAMSKSHGLIVNSFDELESSYTDYWNRNIGPKAWCIGPLCLAKPRNTQASGTSSYMEWLNEKHAKGEPVLYVAFGTQAQVPDEDLQQIAKGLEESKVSFLWVLRSNSPEILKDFEERVSGRGMVVKEWVDQMEILKHKNIKGFLSHCGWNSVMESICAKVPILALPFMAEQHLNARLIVEVVGVALRIMPCSGTFRGPVSSDEVENMVRELMEGERGEQVRKNMEAVGEAALAAMENSGSSWVQLGQLVEDVCSYAINRLRIEAFLSLHQI